MQQEINTVRKTGSLEMCICNNEMKKSKKRILKEENKEV